MKEVNQAGLDCYTALLFGINSSSWTKVINEEELKNDFTQSSAGVVQQVMLITFLYISLDQMELKQSNIQKQLNYMRAK